MRMDATGWADRAEIEGNLLEELATVFGDGIATETLAAEVKMYHDRYRPQHNADIVFERHSVD